MTFNPQETLQNLIKKYNLIKVGPDTYNEYYRLPFPKCITQCGYLLRLVKDSNILITAGSVIMDLDGDIIYQDTIEYNPKSFEILIKDCYNLLKSIKESQLQKKLERINNDF